MIRHVGWVYHTMGDAQAPHGLSWDPSHHPFLTLLFFFVVITLVANLGKARMAILNRNIYKTSWGKGGGRCGPATNSFLLLFIATNSFRAATLLGVTHHTASHAPRCLIS